MKTEYAPREGTKAHLALEYFKANAQARLATTELAKALGWEPGGLSTMLAPLIEAGLLSAERSGRGYVYHLPPAPAPTDGRLQIATYADGDVSVDGGTATETGVLYTRDQIGQLIDHVTKPHTDLSQRFAQEINRAVTAAQPER